MGVTIAAKKEIISKFKNHDSDTGSPEVQIAILSKRIDSLTEHFKAHKKDHSSRGGLIKLVSQRRRLLEFLKQRKHDSYSKLVKSLGIRG